MEAYEIITIIALAIGVLFSIGKYQHENNC